MARPKGRPTQTIHVPIDKKEIVAEMLGHAIGENQTPYINVRVPKDRVQEIRDAIRK